MHLRIMEWNVQDFFLELEYPITPAMLESMSEGEWQLLGKSDVHLKPLHKIRSIAAIISELEPDIVCFCEVGGAESLKLFAEVFLADGYEAFLVPGNSNRGIESGFLVKRDLGLDRAIMSHRDWPVPFQYPHEIDPVTHHIAAAAAQYYELGEAKSRKLSRDAPVLVLSKEGKTQLAILLVHLKSGFDAAGVDPEGRIRRAAEFSALLAIHQRLQKMLGDAVPIIITGDFNGRASRDETAPEFAQLYRDTELEDALELREVPSYERISQLSFLRGKILAQQLDFIFLPKSLHDRAIHAYVYRFRFEDNEQEIMLPSSFRDRAQLPSDHYPLICELDLEGLVSAKDKA